MSTTRPNDSHDLLSAALTSNSDRLIGYLFAHLTSRHRAGHLNVPPTRQLALDLFGDVAGVALAKAETFDTDRDPLGWLIGIARRVVDGHVRDHLREVYRTRDPEGYSETYAGDLAPIGAEDTWDEDDLFGQLAENDPSAEIDARLDAEKLSMLAPDEADLLRRHHMDGETLAALAAKAGCSEGAMKLRLYRARLRLRRMMGGQ